MNLIRKINLERRTMTRLRWIVTVIVAVQIGQVAEACGRCRRAHAQPRRVACQPRQIAYQAPMSHATPVASPQMVYAQPTVSARPPAPVMATIPQPASGELLPAYQYTAADQGQPAYYYTYDNSGKLIVSQWVDFLFRGGKAEGMPRPPLPVIGALRGRN